MGALDETPVGAKMKVVGVGGGGGNAIESMLRANVEGVDFVIANTDRQALEKNPCPRKVQLGAESTRGLGAGADPEVGRRAAEETSTELSQATAGADMVFVTAGMGGGTGTGAAPIAARLARESGALTVGVVTRPFGFEGRRRARQAEEGIEALSREVDALLVIPNDRLLDLKPDVPLEDAFALADSVLVQAVEGLTGVIRKAGKINVDFADVRSVMSIRGRVIMGLGQARGPDRAVRAAEMAVESPLLDDVSIDGALGLLVIVTASADVTLSELQRACASIEARVNEDANVIFGSVIDPSMRDDLRVTVVASGLPAPGQKSKPIERPAALSPLPTRPPIFRPTPVPETNQGMRRFPSTRLAAFDSRPRPSNGPVLPGFDED